MEGALAIIFVFSIPLLAIVTSHRRQVLEMKLRVRDSGDESLRATVDQLRAEVRSLRDTTTQYDMSFDTALQRIERRVDSLENHAITARVEPVRNIEIQSGR
jgi:uncharacterized protein YlxW (UPF0749 family)